MMGWPFVLSMTADTSVDARALSRPAKSSWFTQMLVREFGGSAYDFSSGAPLGRR